MNDRQATQIFTIRNILVDYCGYVLSHNVIEDIVSDFKEKTQKGSTAWAFKETNKRD